MDRTIKKLGSLKPGAKGRIVAIGSDTLVHDPEAAMIAERLREIGFMEDMAIEVTAESPFGRDPVSVRIDHMSIALRRREAESVLVEIERE